MISLTKTSQLIRKLQPFLVFGLAFGLILLLIYVRYLKPPPAKPQSPISAPTIPQSQVQKNPKIIEFAKNFSINNNLKSAKSFQAIKYRIDQTKAQQIAAMFNFSEKPTHTSPNTLDGAQYDWLKENLSLTLSQSMIIYNNTNLELKGQLLSETELQNKAFAYLENIDILDKNLKLNPDKTEYFDVAKTLQTAPSFEKAKIIQYSFEKLLNELPVVGESYKSSFIKIGIKKDGEIVRLEGRYFEDFKAIDDYPLKSSKEVVSEIEKNKGKVIETVLLDSNNQAFEKYQFQPQGIYKTTITKADLVYYLSGIKDEPMQPVWSIEGTFEKDGDNGRVIIYIPAIKNLANPKP